MSDDHGLTISPSEEVETLKSIYINEIAVEHGDCQTSITVQLYPATADKTEEQYVRLTLVLTLSSTYPHDVPDITIRNPRGLSDEDLERIKASMLEKASNCKGGPMLYELIELVKDYLTAGNRPYGICCICLQGFHDEDVFTRTDCFHYFHSHCLARYMCSFFADFDSTDDLGNKRTGAKQLPCPICREAFTFDLATLSDAPPPFESESAFHFTASETLKELQLHMSDLYIRQKEKGGIIDVEAEKNKYYLEISTAPLNNNVSSSPTMSANSLVVNKVNDHGSCPRPLNPHPRVAESKANTSHRYSNTSSADGKQGDVSGTSLKDVRGGKRPGWPRYKRNDRHAHQPKNGGSSIDHGPSDTSKRANATVAERGKDFKSNNPPNDFEANAHNVEGTAREMSAQTSVSRRGRRPQSSSVSYPRNRFNDYGQQRPRPMGVGGPKPFLDGIARAPHKMPFRTTAKDAPNLVKENQTEVSPVVASVDVDSHKAAIKEDVVEKRGTENNPRCAPGSRGNCPSLWTVCGPPPGFRMKPAFPDCKLPPPPPGFETVE